MKGGVEMKKRKITQAHIRTEDMGDTHVLRVATEDGVEVSVAWRGGDIVQVVVSSPKDG